MGQDHITRTLQNAISSGRVAQAYLFVGPRGIGKTSTARLLAKALNCAQGPTATPCGKCDACKEIAEGRSLDVLEIDGASNNGVDNIRELRDNAAYAPARGTIQDLPHRRGAHAQCRRLQRSAENARGTSRACEIHLGHHGGPKGSRYNHKPVPEIRFAPHTRESHCGALAGDRGKRAYSARNRSCRRHRTRFGGISAGR